MENAHLDHLRVIQASVGGAAGFDRALTGILFGKGSTMVFMFHGGFSYYTAEEADGGRLEKVKRSLPNDMNHSTSHCYEWPAYSADHRINSLSQSNHTDVSTC